MKDASPPEWNTGKIGDVCDLMTGGTPSRTKPEYFDGDIKWLVSGDIHQGEIRDCEGRISREGLANSNARLLPVNSVMIALNGQGKTRGTVAMLRTEATCNQSLVSIMPKDTSRLLPEFVFMNLRGRYDEIRKMTGDAGNERRGLNMRLIREIEIPLPPLEEQRRIVAVLEEAFEGLSRARAHAEANLQNARELFDSWASSVFRRSPESCETETLRTIGEVCQIQSGAGFPKRFQGMSDGDYPFYKVSDMNLPGNEWELHRALNYVSDDVRQQLGAKVFPEGAIVFPKVGGAISTNKKRVVAKAGCVDNNVMGLIPLADMVVPEYLHEWLRSVSIYEFSNKANPPSITQGTVWNWPFRIPSRQEQQEAVTKARRLRSHVEDLAARYSERLNSVDDLRQSLLEKAFSGQLIT